MVLRHASTPTERAQIASILIAHAGTYGVVTDLSRTRDVSRQTLYTWKAIGQVALTEAFTPEAPPPVVTADLERTILTLLVEGHASDRGIQHCLEVVGDQTVSLGTIAGVIAEAEGRALAWFATHPCPRTPRAVALDEVYGNQRRGAYLSVVDVMSAAVWQTAGPVAVDGESWTLVLWEAQDRGLRWYRTISDGGRAIQDGCASVDPQGQHARDVWHVLHLCSQVQGRLDRLVGQLVTQQATVARQAARVAAGRRPLGGTPLSDVAAHAVQLAAAVRTADAFRYLGQELRRLLEVVVVDRRRGVLNGPARREDLAALLALLVEVAADAPMKVQREVTQVQTALTHALPQLLLFTEALDQVQADVAAVLRAEGLALVAWAWQRRRILGPTMDDLVTQLPEAWRTAARVVMQAWETAVRASSAVENWHSILRPHIAVHRKLSPGLLALLAVWHNHHVATRGIHQGQSPLQRSGLTDVPTDWLVALGYPPAAESAERRPRAAVADRLPLVA